VLGITHPGSTLLKNYYFTFRWPLFWMVVGIVSVRAERELRRIKTSVLHESVNAIETVIRPMLSVEHVAVIDCSSNDVQNLLRSSCNDCIWINHWGFIWEGASRRYRSVTGDLVWL
jgi:hypothetical protein